METLLIIGAIVAAVAVAKNNGSVSGVGAVDNDWGARNMYLYVMNTEPLYRRYRKMCFISFERGDSEENVIAMLERMLFGSSQSGQVKFSPGMGRGAHARIMAAKEIYDAFYEDWETADEAERVDVLNYTIRY